MSHYNTRGSGGGLGGFPYRSAHQQGTDGNTNSNGNNVTSHRKKAKYMLRRERGGPICCEIQFQISWLQRRILIGRQGLTIQRLTRDTKCLWDVSKQITLPSSTFYDREREEEDYCEVSIKASCIIKVYLLSFMVVMSQRWNICIMHC